MGKTENKTFGYTGRIAGQGVTLYRRGGKVYARISTRSVPDRQSLGQFKAREKMRHSIALWKCFLKPYKPQMTAQEGTIAYNAFLRANSSLPTVYLTKQQSQHGAALLMPGMVVSEGRLPKVEYSFAPLPGGGRVVLTDWLTGLDADEVRELPIVCNDDLAYLLCTNHRNPQLLPDDSVRFYRLEQVAGEGWPEVRITCCEMRLNQDTRPNAALRDWQFYSVGGRLAIGGADNENTGWAAVVYSDREQSASTQKVVTTCRLYEQYTTSEALERAAKSYGNVEQPGILTPDALSRKTD